MTGRATLLAVALAAFGCGERTEMLVSVETFGLRPGVDVDTVHLVVDDPVAMYHSFDVEPHLCPDADPAPPSCLKTPISVTLYPGSQGGDPVHLLVEGKRAGQVVLSDAAIFTFTTGRSQRLDFVLYGRCLGKLDCSQTNQVCNAAGQCELLMPTPVDNAPDFGVPDDLSLPLDFAGDDLAGLDLTAPPDLTCVPDCTGRICGPSANCPAVSCGPSCPNGQICDTTGQCVACLATGTSGCRTSTTPCCAFSSCNPAADRCDPCGQTTLQTCCAPPSPSCAPQLACDATNHCAACGMRSEVCCAGSTCTGPNLVCDANNTCTDCGRPGQLCCAGAQCPWIGAQPVECAFTNICALCGDLGQPCCGGSACQGMLVCNGGTCQNPPPDLSMPQDFSMPPPCGALGEMCCTGSTCKVGLVCQGVTCQPPSGDGGLSCAFSGASCCPGTPPYCTGGFMCCLNVGGCGMTTQYHCF